MGDRVLLAIQDVVAGYGRVEILHGVSLHVKAGEVLSIIGPNGAGKSTVLKAIMGLVRPSRGHVLFDGREVTGLRTDLVVHEGIGYVPQGRVVFPRMTVPVSFADENLKKMLAEPGRSQAKFVGLVLRREDAPIAPGRQEIGHLLTERG